MVNLLQYKLQGDGQGCTCYTYDCMDAVQMAKQLRGKLEGDCEGFTSYAYDCMNTVQMVKQLLGNLEGVILRRFVIIFLRLVQ